MQPQPSSLAPRRSYEGGEMELPLPGIPGDTSKPTSEEEVSTDAEAPVLLRKVKYHGQQAAPSRVTRRGRRTLRNPQ